MFNHSPEKENFFDSISRTRTDRLHRIVVHITHGADADGLGCELIDQYLNLPKDMELKIYRSFIDDLPLIIKNAVEELHPDAFIITDIGVSVNAVHELFKSGVPFYWYDHHQASRETWRDIETCSKSYDDISYDDIVRNFHIHGDEYRISGFKYKFMDSDIMTNHAMKISGAYIYLYFMQNNLIDLDDMSIKRLYSTINFISMGDTYSMTNLDQNKFIEFMKEEDIGEDITWDFSCTNIIADFPAAIFKKFKGEFFLKIFTNYIHKRDIRVIHQVINSLMEIRKIEFEMFSALSYELTYAGQRYLVVPYAFGEFSYCANRILNTTRLRSSFGEVKYSRDYVIAEVWSEIRDGKAIYKISMRSGSNESGCPCINCYEICKKVFHGGGHTNAAGGTLTSSQFEYFMNPVGGDPYLDGRDPVTDINLLDELKDVVDSD